MTWTLLRKELRQHWWAFLLIAAAAGLGFLMILGTIVTQGQAGTPFEGLRMFVILIATLSALVLCHRLVVVEYQAKTQLFIEALPVSRWWMIAVKYFLGLAVIMLIVGLAFGLAGLLAWHQQLLTWRFASILLVRTASVVWFCYSFFFLMGLMGRYRLAIYIGLLIAVTMLAQMTALDLRRFGPFALLDQTFAYEAESFPWEALRTTWLLGLACSLLAFGLSLTREGSVATLLAEKMSHREKVLIAALLLGSLWAASVLGEKAKKLPFDLKGAATEQREGVLVKVASPAGENDPETQRLARSVADKLVGMREYLGLKQLPTVFITSRRDLDANRFEKGELQHGEGIHVQANFSAKDWRADPFLAWLVQEVLIGATDSRVKLESKCWVLDGFALYWSSRQQLHTPPEADKALALRALYGFKTGFVAQDLQRWLSFKERVGDDIAAGVAWSGLRSLARHQGEESCRRFVQAVLAATDPKDFRVLLRPATLDQLLRRHAGEGLQDFFEQWQKDLAAMRPGLEDELAQIPRLRGQVDFLPLSPESRKVKFRADINPAPAPETRYSFLYRRLPGFDDEVSPKSIERVQNSYAERPEDELPGSFSRGVRLYSTFSLEVPALGCKVISGWRRDELQ